MAATEVLVISARIRNGYKQQPLISAGIVFEFQETGIDWLKTHKRALLGDDPGLGKSRQMILAAQEPVLIVSPAMLKETWEDEIAKWRPDLQYEWLSYALLWRRSLGSYETIIFDECHHLKNRKAKQTLAAEGVAKRTPSVFLASGSPIPNWPHELYMLLRILHPGDKRFTSYWRWIYEWFDIFKPRWGGTKILGLQARWKWSDFVVANGLHDSLLRRTREEVLSDLPPLTETEIVVDMVPSQQRAYDELKRDFLTWLEASGEAVSAWSSGALHTKLSRLTTGLEIVSDLDRGSAKLDALRELLAERKGQPVVLFTHYRRTAEEVAEVARATHPETAIIMGGIEGSGEVARSFQAGKIDALVGTLDKLSEGVTLTKADTCIFVEHSWRPSKNEQAMRRLHRIGQERPVTVIHLLTRDSVDTRMQRVLKSKTDAQIQVLTAAEFAKLL